MNDRTIIQLKSPITVNGATVAQVALRRPKVKDMRAASAAASDAATQEIALIANLCDLAPSDIEELDFGDYAAIQKVLKRFTS